MRVRHSVLRGALAAGLVPALVGLAEAASRPQPTPLTDSQLDAIAAGVVAVSADGTGKATGNSSNTQVSLFALIAMDGPLDGIASGQVSASASATAGSAARASSVLSLSLALP